MATGIFAKQSPLQISLFMKSSGIAVILIVIFPFLQAKAQDTYPNYDTTSAGLNDIQHVINETLPDIEHLLQGKRTFRPFASVLLANDSIATIDAAASIKNGYTEEELKEELSIGALKGLYKVVAIFYQTLIIDPTDGKEKNAVVVFAEHTDDDFAYLFYYPFIISPGKKEVIFEDSFGDFAPQVMFKP